MKYKCATCSYEADIEGNCPTCNKPLAAQPEETCPTCKMPMKDCKCPK
jgi:hypothetical protein